MDEQDYFAANRVGFWLRHQSVPTADSYTAHTWLHSPGASPPRAGAGSSEEASFHVENPLSGTWFLLVAARGGGDGGGDELESHGHAFARSALRADYSVAFTASGCVRGRQVLSAAAAAATTTTTTAAVVPGTAMIRSRSPCRRLRASRLKALGPRRACAALSPRRVVRGGTGAGRGGRRARRTGCGCRGARRRCSRGS